MQFNLLKINRMFAFFLLFMVPLSLLADGKRAMTVEDVMNFHHLYSPALSSNGQWVAYHAWPDLGDGYGMLVSADATTEYRVVRGQHPRFSSQGNWVYFTQKPPLAATLGVKPADQPTDSLILIRTHDGTRQGFARLKRAAFSQDKEYLFVHQQLEEDTTLTKQQTDKLKKAGSPLVVRNLDKGDQIVLPFVENWTVDSLATTLVYSLKDTLEANNGLYYLSLRDLSAAPQAIDASENTKFNRFSWHEKSSRLAYMKEQELEKDTMETAELVLWSPGANAARTLLTQADAPQESFLPFDNRLSWSNDGQRLFFALRPGQLAAQPEVSDENLSVRDSILQLAGVDIWHVEDPLIKTQEKVMYNQRQRLNLTAVYHLEEQRMVPLATEQIPDVHLASSGDYALASTYLPYAVKMTWGGRYRDIYTINLLNGEKHLVLEEFGDMSLISPNGKYMLYFKDKNWHSYNILTREHTNLTGSLDVAFYDETHDTPSEPSSYRLAGWMEDESTALLYDRFDIWQADLTNGNMHNVTNGQGREMQVVLRINKLDSKPLYGKKEQVWIEGFDETTKERAIYTARLDRQGIQKVMDTNQSLRLRALSHNNKTILFTNESFDVFPDLWVSNTRFADPVKISNLTRQLEPFNWGTAELISFRSDDGVDLQAIVVKPGDYDPTRKYPVFVYYYEKYSQRLHDFNQTVVNHRPGFGFYSSNDYVLLLPDIHFVEGRPGASALKSLAPAVNKIIDLGIADPDAIGLHGHSWSGYQTAFVVTQTDLFKAAIAGAPVSNMTSAYGGIRWGSGMARQFQYETGQSRIGASLFEQMHLYIENSPLFYADEINTPMLLMHGDEDEAVPWEQSIEMYLAMRRTGKDVIFLQYNDEPHHPQKYANKLDYTIRMKEYFDYHLKGMEPADWIKEGVPYIRK